VKKLTSSHKYLQSKANDTGQSTKDTEQRTHDVSSIFIGVQKAYIHPDLDVWM